MGKWFAFCHQNQKIRQSQLLSDYFLSNFFDRRPVLIFHSSANAIGKNFFRQSTSESKGLLIDDKLLQLPRTGKFFPSTKFTLSIDGQTVFLGPPLSDCIEILEGKTHCIHIYVTGRARGALAVLGELLSKCRAGRAISCFLLQFRYVRRRVLGGGSQQIIQHPTPSLDG